MPASVENTRVYFEVAVLEAPYTGFAVMRMDLDEPSDEGVVAVVVGTHLNREEAHSEANRLALGQLSIN